VATFVQDPPRFFHNPLGFGKKAPPFGDNCARRTKRLHFLDVYPRGLYEYPSSTIDSATSGATSGATCLEKFGPDNQAVKCQVCRVSPPVDVEESL